MTIISEKQAWTAGSIPTTAQVGADLLINSIHRLQGYDRDLEGLGLAALAEAGSGALQFFVGDVLVATLYAQGTTAPQGYELVPVDAVVPAGSELRAIVREAFSASSTGVILVIEIYDAEDDMDDMDDMLVAAMG